MARHLRFLLSSALAAAALLSGTGCSSLTKPEEIRIAVDTQLLDANLGGPSGAPGADQPGASPLRPTGGPHSGG